MQLKTLQAIYEQKDTAKGRKYLSRLIFPGNKDRIKLLRIGCDYSASGKATCAKKDYEKRFKNKKGETIGLKQSKITNFSLFVPKGAKRIKKIKTAKGHTYKKSILVNDGGKKVSMRAIDQPHKLKDILGYYPHIYYKDSWRPLFYRINKKKLQYFNYDYYGKNIVDFKKIVLDLDLFCYIYRSTRANAPKDSAKRVWNVQSLLDSFAERRLRQHF